jgi:hypothetical protein
MAVVVAASLPVPPMVVILDCESGEEEAGGVGRSGFRVQGSGFRVQGSGFRV